MVRMAYVLIVVSASFSDSTLLMGVYCTSYRGLRVKRTKKQDTKPNKGLRHFSVKV